MLHSLLCRCAPSVVHIRTSAVARSPFSQDATEIPQGTGCVLYGSACAHAVMSHACCLCNSAAGLALCGMPTGTS